MSVEQITHAKIFLEAQDWNDVNASSLNDVIEEIVIKLCDHKSSKRLNKEDKEFKCKNLIPRMED